MLNCTFYCCIFNCNFSNYSLYIFNCDYQLFIMRAAGLSVYCFALSSLNKVDTYEDTYIHQSRLSKKSFVGFRDFVARGRPLRGPKRLLHSQKVDL